jgi:hypothetical protein
MRPEYLGLIERRLTLPLSEGPDKVTALEAAVSRLVGPGQTIYFGAAHGRPSALVRELGRQWWGRNPGWTLAMTGFGSPWTALVVGGLVERLITTFIGEGYPYPTPQPLVGRAVLDGRLHVQNSPSGRGRRPRPGSRSGCWASPPKRTTWPSSATSG